MQNKIKIILIGRYNPSEILTGPKKAAKRIFRNFKQFGQDTLFIDYFFKDRNDSNYFRRLFGKKESTEDPDILTIGWIRILFYLLKIKPQIIHIITYERFLIVIFLYRFLNFFKKKAKIIYTVHGIISYENRYRNNLPRLSNLKDKICEAIIYKYSDLFFFLSDLSITKVQEYYQIDKSKIALVSNGIDEIFYRVKKKSSNAKLLKIVLSGNLSNSIKGIEFALEALPELNELVELFLISDEKEKFLNYNLGQGIKIKVVPRMPSHLFASFLEDKSVFLCSSVYETFSITTFEAMAAGLVPVVTNETGAARFIENGKNGFLFRYGDKKKLREIISILANDKKTLKKISIKSRKIYEGNSWNNAAQNYLKLYQKLIK